MFHIQLQLFLKLCVQAKIRMASVFGGLTFKMSVFTQKCSFGLDEYLVNGGNLDLSNKGMEGRSRDYVTFLEK